MALFQRYRCTCPRRRRTTQVRTNDIVAIPSSIQCSTNTTQTFASGNALPFSSANINTGVSFTFANGDNFINIVSSGVFVVDFCANLTSTTDTLCQLAIATNDASSVISQVVQTVSANETQNIKTQLLIKVATPTVKISIVNNGTTSYSVLNANISIIKTGNF